MEKSVEYIESHLGEELNARRIADYVGYSLYHYCRIFLACYGMPLMEYVRRRRLSLGAQALRKGRRITDAALDYGFETPSGFAKAFRREYGVAPKQYVAYMNLLERRLSDHTACELEIGECFMLPVIVEKPAIKVAGYAINTTISGAKQTRDVAALWDRFDTDGWEGRLYDQLQPPKHGEVGVFVPGQGDEVAYVLGVIVGNFDRVTEDMVRLEIPAATYAVFTTPPIDVTVDGLYGKANTVDFPNVIKNTWKFIFEEWFRDSDYEYDQDKLDFEFYDERCHFRPDTVMEIYVPVKRKSIA